MPKDIDQRALMNQWVDWQNSDLTPKSLYAVLGIVRKVPGYHDLIEQAEALKTKSHEMLLFAHAHRPAAAPCLTAATP